MFQCLFFLKIILLKTIWKMNYFDGISYFKEMNNRGQTYFHRDWTKLIRKTNQFIEQLLEF